MKASVKQVVDALAAAGLDVEVQEFAASTRTAEDAAAALDIQVGQIVKSLVFLADGQPVLALVSGSHRVDMEKLAGLTGAVITRADADAVRRLTGFSIGGVPPVGHESRLPSYCDPGLLSYETVWAAAGTPNAVFAISPTWLVQLAEARVADFCV